MKLYGDVLSPFVRMSLVTGIEAGLGTRLEHIKESVKPTEVNAKLVSLSPIGKVPVLETDHNHAIYDSRVIMEYLAHVAGNLTLIPDDGVKRFRILTMSALGQGLADSAVGYRYETAARPQGLQWDDWISRTQERMAAIASDLNNKWSGEFGQVHVGTIAVAVTLSYIDYRLPEIAWRTGNQKLADFHSAFSERPSMQATRLG
jgi:glutathione S-transferase